MKDMKKQDFNITEEIKDKIKKELHRSYELQKGYLFLTTNATYIPLLTAMPPDNIYPCCVNAAVP